MGKVQFDEFPDISKLFEKLTIIHPEVTNAYFAKREEEAEYKLTVKEHPTRAGETLSKIAKKHKVKIADVKRTKTTKYLQVGEIVNVSTKEKIGIKVKFTKLDKATVGEHVYIVVETLHLEEETVLINILQGQEDVLAKKDELVAVQQDNQGVTLIKTKVGNYCEEDDIINKDDFINYAIVKIILQPKEEALQTEWQDSLESAGEKKGLLYLLVDVHTENSLPNFKAEYVIYKGFKGGKEDSAIPNHFLNEENAWFEITDESSNVYEINIDKKTYKKSKTLLKSKDYIYKVYDGKELLKVYKLKSNNYNLLDFPKTGDNWGRYGSRDKGGDNWINEKAAAGFLGLLHSLQKEGIKEKIYFNDISANDKRNIGHKTHKTGHDIDIRYPGADNSSGGKLWSISKDYYKTEVKFVEALEKILKNSTDWDFEKKYNYAYKKDIKYTSGKAISVHQDHYHIGFKR